MLNWDYVPGCCSAITIYNFGGTENSLYGQGKVAKDFPAFVDWAIERFGKLMLVATTTNEQTEVNTLLAEKGFVNIGWMHNNLHPYTVFTMWYRKPDYDKELIDRFWEGEIPNV